MTTPNPGAWRHPRAGEYSNAHAVAADLRQYGAGAAVAVIGVTRTYAMLLETRIKANASGRPGPRAITGAYRRSWHHTVTVTPTEVSGRVGTSQPQGPRLEYGFVGADRLGRVYNQQPYAHVGPAVERTDPEFLVALGKAVQP